MATLTRSDRIAGTLFGTAIGDALGLYVEGLPAAIIKRKFGKVDRYLTPFGFGLLSDDTEQTALICEAMLEYGYNPDFFEQHLRWLMVKWFWTCPPGIGKATAKACFASTFGSTWTDRNSAGNGAAMRAAIIGVMYCFDSVKRKTIGVRAARVTHSNDDAIDAALFVAELATACLQAELYERFDAAYQALMSIPSESLHNVIERAMNLADDEVSTADAAAEIGCSGWVLESVALATFCFLRFCDDPRRAMEEIIACGGDTDSNAAILGAWLGAMHGMQAWPDEWVEKIVTGPIDLRSLAHALAGESTKYSGFCYWKGLLKNLVTIPYLLMVAVARKFY